MTGKKHQCDSARCHTVNHKCLARETICHNCKKKGHFGKVCRSEHRKQQKIREITESDDTEETDTDKFKKIITELKHVTDQKKSQYQDSKKRRNRTRIYCGNRITGYTIYTG